MKKVINLTLYNIGQAKGFILVVALLQILLQLGVKVKTLATTGLLTGQFFADYHVQVDADGGIYVIGDGVLDDVLAATYLRNSGSVSIALLGCVGATTDDLGCEPPTAAQIEALAQAVTALADGLWLTIDKERILTHGEAADNEDGVHAHAPYGPSSTCERWDLEYLGTEECPAFRPWATDGTRGGDVIRGKAQYYRERLSITQ